MLKDVFGKLSVFFISSVTVGQAPEKTINIPRIAYAIFAGLVKDAGYRMHDAGFRNRAAISDSYPPS
jgi:hypothetical protein